MSTVKARPVDATPLLKRLATRLSGTATFPTVSTDRLAKYAMVNAALFGLSTGQPVKVEGAAGFGKTSFIKQICELAGYDVAAIHVPLFTPEGAGVPMPVDETHPDGTTSKYLEFVLREGFAKPGRKVILLDEWNRAAPNTANILMELLSEGSIAGIDLTDLVCVFALQNPQASGYALSNVDDIATATRFVSVQLERNDTPWREAIALRYPTLNLTTFFRTWNNLPGKAQLALNPRVLDHLIQAVINGLPAIFAIPAPNNERLLIHDDDGRDIGERTLRDLTHALPGGAFRHPEPGDVDLAYDLTLRNGWNLKDIRDPGTGKTKRAKARCAAAGIRAEYFSGPVMTPTDFGAVLPARLPDGTTVLQTAKWKRLTGDPYVLTIDEESRASKRVKNVLMELYQERTIDGQPTPVHAIIALDNPREIVVGVRQDGQPLVERLNVGTTDAAQAGRFDLTLIGMSEAEQCYQWLIDTYSDTAIPFTVWHREELDNLGRFYVNFRVLELLLQCHQQQVTLEWALPLIGGKRAPVPLGGLKRRIADRPRATLSTFADNIDTWVGYLKARADHADEYAGVIRALDSTEVSVMETHRKTVVALISALDQDSLIGLIRGASPERLRFLTSCIKEAG